ncbi:hypothetical protein [Streptomyces olivoreticuli]|uniref:hypothetical protein n=1 Tax=Streptomyces olivoreticuli TaxID=68246 RepID=UPI000E26084C|nr:hypothetical protein [Streptomyces olivoreticuli]
MRNGKYGIAASVLAGLALFATACVGGTENSGKDSSSKGSDSSGKDNEADAAYKYRDCLRKNGAKVTEPKDEKHAMGIEGDPEKVKKAMKACADLPGGPGKGEISQADKDKALKFAQCMRKNGIDMPDPKFDGGAMTSQRLPENDKGKFEKANKACSDQNGE